MKAKLVTVCVLVVVFALMLSFSVPAPASPQPASPRAVPAAAAQPSPRPAAVPAPHPEIRDAILALRNARAHLDHASHDFGGHRVEAIKAIDEALNQLNICMKYDK